MTFQTRAQAERMAQAASPAAAEMPLPAPPHAPLKMPRQRLQAEPGHYRRALAALLFSRLPAALRPNMRRTG
ncbi:hypothetical protein [Pseudotabrizicola algicola]|uniref:Uncharacterized protein n=1 Tax=Pseudotabrizicola algicola TaxID=2709381 RepID=A0A6B3RQ00_9RHOB|nr:hypothetical protein [Pseudotabrizicola algicola]NEX47306.1 hypothetical protein [Pseudotabrizicola algicola]